MRSKGTLPGFFKPDGGWLAHADNYMRLFEPLFIANYYQFQVEPTPYLAEAGDDTPLKRPRRYWRIEQVWAGYSQTGHSMTPRSGQQLMNSSGRQLGHIA